MPVFGIGSTELFIIAIFGLLLFGPDKLPKMARTFGKWKREFERAQDSMQAQIKAEIAGLDAATDPNKKPETPTAVAVDPEWDEEEEEE